MRTLQINTKTDLDGHLRLDMLLTHSAMEISVILVMGDIPSPKGGYDCADLAGKLTWQGDAVKEQWAMRQEWK